MRNSVVVAVSLGLGIFALGCGGSASAEHADLLPAMLAEIRAMPGYEVEPATFDRYVEESHGAAVEKAFAGGAESDDLTARDVYAVEVYRNMVDRAFSDGRTDLTDVLTRAYMNAAEARR
jgi:hypothetical protein